MTIIQKNLVGIDIGAKNVKMVKVNNKGKITNYAYVDLPEKIIQNGRIESKQMLTETLKIARRKLGTSFKDCVLCIDNSDTVIRQITIPQMEEEYIRNNIALELGGFLPVSPDRYAIDYIVTGTLEENEKKLMQLLVFAVPSDIVQSYSACVKAAGFKLKYIDIMENAYEKLHKTLKRSRATSDENFACLYMDSNKTSFSVFGNGKFFINKVIDNGISKICQEISEKTNRPPEIVKNTIFNNDILNFGETFSVEKNVIEKNMKDIALDATRVIDYFRSRNKDAAVTTIYLSGGLSNLDGIQMYLQTLLGVPVVITSQYFDSVFKDIPKKNNGIDYTNAIAITLREENS